MISDVWVLGTYLILLIPFGQWMKARGHKEGRKLGRLEGRVEREEELIAEEGLRLIDPMTWSTSTGSTGSNVAAMTGWRVTVGRQDN